MNNIVISAHEIAHHVHRGQYRNDGIEPYVNHCERVARILISHFPHFSTEENIATALLHDALEDCGEHLVPKVYEQIFTQCGSVVAAQVDVLTKPAKPKHFRNKRYQAKLALGPKDVIVVKLADRIDNLNSISSSKWDIVKILNYVKDSVQLYEIACQRQLYPEAQLLLTSIMLVQTYITTMNFK